MSDSDEIYTSDESEYHSDEGEIGGSDTAATSDDEPVSGAPSRDVTVGDSDDGDSDPDESVLVRKKQTGKKKRAAVIDSDPETGDEEEDELESRALSPRTRMSITGIRPADLTDDDSSEIEYSDEETPATKKALSNISEVYDTSEGEDLDDSAKSDHQGTPRNTPTEQSSIVNSKENNSSSDDSIVDDDSSDVAESFVETPKRTALQQQDNEKDAGIVHQSSPSIPARYSIHFAQDIGNKLSSTLYQPRETAKEFDSSADSDRLSTLREESLGSTNKKEDTSDSDVEIIEKNVKPIVLSSEDEDFDKENVSASNNSSASFQQHSNSVRNLVQPKISSALTKPQPAVSKVRNTPQKIENIRRVSQEYYDKETKKFAELKSELSNAEKLLSKIAKTLPDGGRQLSLRIERLRSDTVIKSKYISTLSIEDAPGASGPSYPPDDKDSPSQKLQEIQKHRKAFFNNQAPDWDELSAAVNQIQPTHTGKQGMATFNTQKVLTVDRLKVSW